MSSESGLRAEGTFASKRTPKVVEILTFPTREIRLGWNIATLRGDKLHGAEQRKVRRVGRATGGTREAWSTGSVKKPCGACAAETVQNRAKTSKLQNRASTVSRVVNVLDTIHLPVQKRVVKARADLLCFARVA